MLNTPPAEWEAYERLQIPKFFGLLESLTYLNLSRAQFQGEIPHNLGNLPKLQYLDLRSNNWWDIEATSLEWISRLSSLHYLDLSYADLCKATYWLQVLEACILSKVGPCWLRAVCVKLDHVGRKLYVSWATMSVV
ncbi:hypothetical protein GOBAR_DD11222 [Gossypium barbadense]|nr:hypothetical protein GOBAR_DD11222 [Gossypium barbadense]